MPHEEVGYLLEQRGVPVIQVCARGDWQLGEREFGADWEWRGGYDGGDFRGGLGGEAGGQQAVGDQLGSRGRDV